MTKKKPRYESRVFDGRIIHSAEIERMHREVLDFKHIEAISEPMRELIEDLWPELANKLPAESQLTQWLSPCAPPALVLGSARTARTTPCSAASGILAESMKFEAVPSIYDGFWHCTSRASRRTYALITAWPRWTWQRRSSRRAGANGWRGQS